jgi:hypothetical protein
LTKFAVTAFADAMRAIAEPPCNVHGAGMSTDSESLRLVREAANRLEGPIGELIALSRACPTEVQIEACNIQECLDLLRHKLTATEP